MKIRTLIAAAAALLIPMALAAQAPVASFYNEFHPAVAGAGVAVRCGGSQSGLRGAYVCEVSESSGTVTVQYQDSSSVAQTLTFTTGTGSGSADGVVSDADYTATDGDLVLTRSVGAALTVNVDELIHPDSNGDLPDPEDRQGRVAVSGNQLLHSIDHGAVDKVVEFKAYGPDRVVESGEPALLTDESNFQGSFAGPPPFANYSVGDFLWDRGSSVWLIRRSGSTTWGTTGGPHGYAPGHLYATEAVAAQHVTGTGYFHPGGVVIYGQGSAQRPYVITGFTAGSAASWQWDPIGVIPGEVDGAITARLSDDDPEDVATAAAEGTSTDTARSDHVHELASGVVTTPKYGTQSLSGSKLQLETVSSTDANTRVLLFDTADDQIGTGQVGTVNLLDGSVTSAKLASGAAGVVIASYSATATYSRGANNSFVTDGGELYVYTSGSERSSNHNPGTNPQYWFRVSHGTEFINVGSGSHRYKAGTFLLVDNAIYLATTNITTARAAAYIIANAGDDQEFLLVNGDAGRISWGFVIDTLIVPELNQDAIATPRIVLEDSGLTHYLTFLDWTAANLDTIDHLPVGAHIGLRQGTTTRILEVEAAWDSTNDRYQVININTGILSESASGTATELLLTAGAGGGGFTLHVGAGAPASSLGDDDDWYLRTSNGQWYEKASGAWASRYTDQIGQAGSGLTAVSTTANLSGDGTSSDPLDIADDGVTTAKLADDAVTGDKIADDTIHGGALIDGTIATVKIGDSQVTGAKLSSSAVSTGKLADSAVTQDKIAEFSVVTNKIANLQVTSAKLAANAAGEGKVPIDDTMQFDGSGNLGVNTQRVVQTVSEWVQHFASGSAHDTSGHTGKYHEYTSSNTVRRVGSVQYDFTPANSGGTKTYRVYIIELTGRNVDAVLGVSEPYSGNNLQHRFHFTDGGDDQPSGADRYRAASDGRRRQQLRLERAGRRGIARQSP